MSPFTCWPGPRSKSEPSRSGRPAVSRSALVSAPTAARVPPNRMKPPTPAASACSILARSDRNEPRRQRSAGHTRRARGTIPQSTPR